MFGRTLDGRRWSARAGLLLLGLTAACSESAPVDPEVEESTTPLLEEVREQSAPRFSTQGVAPAMAPCGDGASYTLWAGRDFPGKITVSNDAQNLYVTYAINDATEAAKEAGWFISDTRVSVTRTVQTIPLGNDRLPNPWAFPHAGVHDPVVKSHTHIIPLSTYNLKPGEKIVVAAMAGVVHPKNPKNWSGAWEWLVGWGIGNISGKTLKDLANYTVQGCGSTPPPSTSAKGAITITFDDGWLDTYTNAYPVLKAAGLEANVALNPTTVDEQWDTYMRLNHVQELHNAGWTIVSHTMSHPDLVTLSDAELHRQLRDSQAWLRNKGFNRGSHILVVPFHSWGERERQAAMQYYKGGRGYTVNQFSPALMQPFPVPASKYFEITGYEPEFAPFTTSAGRELTRDYLERAVGEGEVIDIFFHHITEADLPAFREMVKILKEFEDAIVTYDKIIPA